MTRGKDGGDDWGKFLAVLMGVSAGAVLLYYLTAGRDEKDAALMPNRLEDRIDLVVRTLNERFGHRWVNLGLDVLELYLKSILPWPVVSLVNVIYQIEKLPGMQGPDKQWQAANRLRTAFQ